ncbi:MAG: hypothetical protein LBV44_10110 [Methylobacillus sp.]|jgi:hypothetical protein|nr:hypothetical protein [Methylobacillus sp.]
MATLSSILYFFSNHRFLMVLFTVLMAGLVGVLMARIRKRKAWYVLGMLGFAPGIVLVFTISFINALFLNRFGLYGSAVIIHNERTNDRLNKQYIHRYDVVVKTQDGRDVETGFDTMSAPSYPIQNAIYFPPVGERFLVKYIPGAEHNIVIMREESAFGRNRMMAEDRAPVERARERLKTSPNNPDFKAAYRDELHHFLRKHEQDLPPVQADYLRAELNGLNNAKPPAP